MWSHEVYEVTKSVCFVSCLCPSGSTSEEALRDEMHVMTLSASLSNHPYSNTVNLLRGWPWWQRWRAHVGATAWFFNMPDNLAECPGCHRGGQTLTSPASWWCVDYIRPVLKWAVTFTNQNDSYSKYDSWMVIFTTKMIAIPNTSLSSLPIGPLRTISPKGLQNSTCLDMVFHTDFFRTRDAHSQVCYHSGSLPERMA